MTSTFSGSRVMTSALGVNVDKANESHGNDAHFGEMLDTTRYNQAPYGSPYTSRTPSRVSTPAPTPLSSEGDHSP
jgi:UDP-sugar transporter A1/2/3